MSETPSKSPIIKKQPLSPGFKEKTAFALEFEPKNLEIPRNGTLKVKVKNVTDKWQEVQLIEIGLDIWITKSHNGVLWFVLGPQETKKFVLNHGDRVTGKEYDRQLKIEHVEFKEKERAIARREQIAAKSPTRKEYDTFQDVDGTKEFRDRRAFYQDFFQELHKGPIGTLYIPITINPAPPVTEAQLAENPAKARKQPEDKIAKKCDKPSFYVKKESWQDGHCCCYCWFDCPCCPCLHWCKPREYVTDEEYPHEGYYNDKVYYHYAEYKQ